MKLSRTAVKNQLLVISALFFSISSSWIWAQDAHDEHMNSHEQPMTDHTEHAVQPTLRDPHAYSGDFEFGKNLEQPDMMHRFYTGALMINRLEQQFYQGDVSTQYDVQVWYGSDDNRAVLKAEGDIANSQIEEARTELLWSTPLYSFWDMQLGVRQDGGDGTNRTWLAAGLQGLAPYWFEVDAALYLSDSGRAALRLETDYELLLTQKLILQPRLEAQYYSKSDASKSIGKHLSSVTAGLRLRYEFVPEFAPYLGIEWQNLYGETKSLIKTEGEKASRLSWVAGLKFWF